MLQGNSTFSCADSTYRSNPSICRIDRGVGRERVHHPSDLSLLNESRSNPDERLVPFIAATRTTFEYEKTQTPLIIIQWTTMSLYYLREYRELVEWLRSGFPEAAVGGAGNCKNGHKLLDQPWLVLELMQADAVSLRDSFWMQPRTENCDPIFDHTGAQGALATMTFDPWIGQAGNSNGGLFIQVTVPSPGKYRRRFVYRRNCRLSAPVAGCFSFKGQTCSLEPQVIPHSGLYMVSGYRLVCLFWPEPVDISSVE